MRRRKVLGSIGAAALIGAGAIAATSIAGNDGEPRQLAGPQQAAPLTAERPAGPAAGAAAKRGKKKRKKPTIQTFYAAVATVPPEGGGLVQPVICPRGRGEPIGGGARTSQGLVINYLSRINPQSGAIRKRVYYVGVEDVSDANPPGSGAIVEVQCAKRIRVPLGA
jgi:hypothetical protein